MKKAWLVFSLLILAALPAIAADAKLRKTTNAYPQCSDLLAECMVQASTKKTACFFSAAKHPFCQGSLLGDLALKRWAIAPNRFGDTSTPPAFLGPKLVNENCLTDIDNKVKTSIESNLLDENAIRDYMKNMDTCTKEMGDQLTQP